MTWALLDDHLLRDLLADDVAPALTALLATRRPATTNLYAYRLAKSVIASRGGALTGSWTATQRGALGARLLDMRRDVEVLPMIEITFRMGEIANTHRVSTLGAEAIAAAEQLEATLCVWSGDDGPGIRAAAEATGLEYVTIAR